MRILATNAAADPGMVEVPVNKVQGGRGAPAQDVLAVEEPLEIRVGYSEQNRPVHRAVSVTMRTPGHDFDLAAGFLFTEGIIPGPEAIEGIRHCGLPAADGSRNTVRVQLRPDVTVELRRLERHFYTTSSCGVCGKTSIEAIQVGSRHIPASDRPVVDAQLVEQLPERLRSAQSVFNRTGGLHAAALFDAQGKLLCVREDVGRHNAVDKLIGAQMLAGRVPMSEEILLVSGRASFELVQKALMAGIPILAAVGAPSSLAVELAGQRGMTVLGFVRDGRFNIYSGGQRIRAE